MTLTYMVVTYEHDSREQLLRTAAAVAAAAQVAEQSAQSAHTPHTL